MKKEGLKNYDPFRNAGEKLQKNASKCFSMYDKYHLTND